jgi:hypothetical protein
MLNLNDLLVTCNIFENQYTTKWRPSCNRISQGVNCNLSQTDCILHCIGLKVQEIPFCTFTWIIRKVQIHPMISIDFSHSYLYRK